MAVVEAHDAQAEIEATGVGAMLVALEARDGYTGRHCDAVLELATAVGRRLGLSAPELRELGHVALLHDVGKIGIPDAVLQKPGKLAPHERQIMERHPEIGEQMICRVEPLAHLAPPVRAEHERWDGRGYPDGVSGEEIPFTSQIVFACDAYHAMCSHRPYRPALSPTMALRELRKGRGTEFCPRVVDALVEVLPDVFSTPDGHWRYAPGSGAAAVAAGPRG